MSRYATMFAALKDRREIGFGAFLMLGHPTPKACLAAVDELVDGGVDFLELGIPFSDPVADGPVIQAAAARALAAGVKVSDALNLVAAVRQRHASIPIGVLTYANIVAACGREALAMELAGVGVDSLLVADVPAFEAAPYVEAFRNAGIAPVLIAAANTPDDTLARIARMSDGYTYVVARKGITGTENRGDIGNAAPVIKQLFDLQAPPPILGFGISERTQVAEAAAVGAKGVICGSAMIERLDRGEPVRQFVEAMKAATSLRAAIFPAESHARSRQSALQSHSDAGE